jgi:hypothetical protein
MQRSVKSGMWFLLQTAWKVVVPPHDSIPMRGNLQDKMTAEGFQTDFIVALR